MSGMDGSVHSSQKETSGKRAASNLAGTRVIKGSTLQDSVALTVTVSPAYYLFSLQASFSALWTCIELRTDYNISAVARNAMSTHSLIRLS